MFRPTLIHQAPNSSVDKIQDSFDTILNIIDTYISNDNTLSLSNSSLEDVNTHRSHLCASDIHIGSVASLVQTSVELLAREWKEVEADFLPEGLCLPTLYETWLNTVIPEGLNISDINANDASALKTHIISDKCKTAYFSKLLELFRRIPKHNVLQGEILARGCQEFASSSIKDVVYQRIWSRAGVHIYDPKRVHLLERVEEALVAPASPTSRENIFTFSLYHPDSGKCQQIISLLGSQTLFDLRTAQSCINQEDTTSTVINNDRDQDPNRNINASTGTDVRIDNRNRQSSRESFFYFINGIFYMDLGPGVTDALTDTSLFPEPIRDICNWFSKPPISVDTDNQTVVAAGSNIDELLAGDILASKSHDAPVASIENTSSSLDVPAQPSSAVSTNSNIAGSNKRKWSAASGTEDNNKKKKNQSYIGSIPPTTGPATATAASRSNRISSAAADITAALLQQKLNMFRQKLSIAAKQSDNSLTSSSAPSFAAIPSIGISGTGLAVEQVHTTTAATATSAGVNNSRNNFLERCKEFNLDPLSSDILTIKNCRYAQVAQLHCQLGAKYLFSHLGACEHFLYLTDVRLIASPESQSHVGMQGAKVKYPVVNYKAKVADYTCHICQSSSTAFVVYGDRLLDNSLNCFFCEQCYYMLHYSAEGQLLYKDFMVFPLVKESTV